MTEIVAVKTFANPTKAEMRQIYLEAVALAQLSDCEYVVAMVRRTCPALLTQSMASSQLDYRSAY